MPSSTTRPARADEARRQLDRGNRAGRLDHDVEPAADQPVRRLDGVRLADVHGRVCADALGEAQFIGPDPVGDERAGRRQPRQRHGKRAERADADYADRLARPERRALETAQHTRRRLDQHRGVERHVVRKAMHDMARHEHELAVAAGAREPELVVVLAQLGVAGLAPATAIARDHPLTDDPVAWSEVAHPLAGLLDRAAPFVTGNDLEPYPARIGEMAVHDLEVRAADTGHAAADDDVPRAWNRPVEFDVRDLVRPLDEDGLHGRSLYRRRMTTAERFHALYTGAVTDVLDRRGLLRQTLPAELAPLEPGTRLAGPCLHRGRSAASGA
jgi:phosphoglycolate phosphatase-like HAD superfamily hydrolase